MDLSYLPLMFVGGFLLACWGADLISEREARAYTRTLAHTRRRRALRP